MKIKSQGDVTFIPIEELPLKMRRVADGIVARGESTRHTHAIADLEQAQLYEIDGVMYLSVGEHGVSIVHQEHAPVELEPGSYKIHIDQAYDYSASRLRNVQD